MFHDCSFIFSFNYEKQKITSIKDTPQVSENKSKFYSQLYSYKLETAALASVLMYEMSAEENQSKI